ncbi:MAG: endolytic transglycosylase MltG [Hyphomicrobiaceae bacterium]|nr:endolytic transglycosylase MltG [Hyphomicrobiaceae bacterium]
MSNQQPGAPQQRRPDITAGKRPQTPRSPAEQLQPGSPPSRPRRKRPKAPPSRRLTGFARFVSGIFTIALAAMVVSGLAMLWLYHEFERAGPLAVTRTVGVPKGEGPIEIAARLEREGIISNRWAFVASHYVRNLMSQGKPAVLKAGEYEIRKSASMSQVRATIVEGKSILHKVTLPEGLTSAQIIERLTAEETLTGEITEIPPEGSLLPDTYRFSKGTTRQEIVDRMVSEQQKFLAAMWEKRKANLPVSTPEQALVLASIVEKETGRADERQRVAAVFVNRLRKNMRLQSDPTIVYGLVGGKGSLGRPITRSDIDSKTAYNTYQINGLPPGPICNPGRSAIEATLDPAETQDLYFVADGSGGHAFSETLKEHNAAVSNWRKVEKQARDEAASQPSSAPSSAPLPQAAPATAPTTPSAVEGAIPVAPSATRAVSRPAPPAANAAGSTTTPGQSAALPQVIHLNAAASGATKVKTAKPEAPAEIPAATNSDSAPAGDVPLPARKPKR